MYNFYLKTAGSSLTFLMVGRDVIGLTVETGLEESVTEEGERVTPRSSESVQSSILISIFED